VYAVHPAGRLVAGVVTLPPVNMMMMMMMMPRLERQMNNFMMVLVLGFGVSGCGLWLWAIALLCLCRGVSNIDTESSRSMYTNVLAGNTDFFSIWRERARYGPPHAASSAACSCSAAQIDDDRR